MKKLFCLSVLMLLALSIMAREPRILVTYFSLSGNTKAVAEKIALYTGADLYRIEPVTPYPDNMDSLICRAKEEMKGIRKIEIKKSDIDLKNYDIVFIGSPVWFGDWVPEVEEFARLNNLRDVKVMPFVTSGKFYDQDIMNHLYDAIKTQSRVKGLCLTQDPKGTPTKDIITWLEDLGLVHSFWNGSDFITDLAVKKAIANMQAKYPKLTTFDIYKSFYQDNFGPGHLIPNKATAKKYLKSERKDLNQYSVGAEPTGALGRYIRVDINYINKKKIKQSVYLNSLMKSVDNEQHDIKLWEEEWHFIVKCLMASEIKIENFQAELDEIEKRFYRGEYTMSHSPQFRNAYNPHYRIIKRSEYDKFIYPLIKK